MKFDLDGFVVTITVEKDGVESKRALAQFLTRLACHEWLAKECNENMGYTGSAAENREYALVFGDNAAKVRGC